MADSYDDVLRLVRAGVNVLHIASFEWRRVQAWSTAVARDLKVPLMVWSSSAGLLTADEEGSLSSVDDGFCPPDDELTEPIEAMLRLRDCDGGGVLLLEDAHPYLEPSQHEVVRWIRQLCRMGPSPRRLLILSTPMPGLVPDLQKEVPTVDLPLPGVDDLEYVAQEVAELDGGQFFRDPALLEAARGLTVMEARLAFGQAANQFGRLDSTAVPLVVREKERVIRQSQVLEYYEPDARMADVGGLDNLKQWLDRRGLAFGPGARDFGLDAPKGVLLLGVQGCGKSLVAKAIAASWQFPLLRFDVGKVFGGLLGQSEGNMRSALQIAQALAPCVLWIDEIEKGLSGVGGSERLDGGTTARVVGSLLTWMQEKREPVFVVATANRIEMLPPELLRKGRFDEIFFVDLPTASVREDILRIHLRKKKRDPDDFDLSALAGSSLGYSGAELEEAIREGLTEAYADQRDLRTDDIAGALKATFPLSRTMSESIAQLREWARVRARLASSDLPELLPAAADRVPRLKQEETRNPFIPGSRGLRE
jgi:AAA+ superfamily predicted ATPase